MEILKRDFTYILKENYNKTTLEELLKNADYFQEEAQRASENENKIELLLKSFNEYIKAINFDFIPAYGLISDTLDLLHSCRDDIDRTTFTKKDDTIKLFYLENGASKGDLYCIKKLIIYYFNENNFFSNDKKAKKYLFKLVEDYNHQKIEETQFSDIIGSILLSYLIFCVLNMEPTKLLDIIKIYKKNIQDTFCIEYEEFKTSQKGSKMYIASISEEELEYNPTYQINKCMINAFEFIKNLFESCDFSLLLFSNSEKTEYQTSYFMKSKTFWRNLGYFNLSILENDKSHFIVNKNDYTYDDNMRTLRNYLTKAKDYAIGTNNTIPDPRKAIEIYKRTLKYNYIISYREIGTIYYFGQFTSNTRTDKENKQFLQEAYKYFRDGANLGDNLCYLLLTKLYFDKNSEYYNVRQGIACLDVFFEEFDHNLLELKLNEIFEYEVRIKDALLDYIEYCTKNNIEPLFQKYYQLLSNHVNDSLDITIRHLNIARKGAKKNKEDIMALALENMILYYKFLRSMVESNDYRKHINNLSFLEIVKKLDVQYLVNNI